MINLIGLTYFFWYSMTRDLVSSLLTPPWKKTRLLLLLSFRVAFAGNLSFWTFFFRQISMWQHGSHFLLLLYSMGCRLTQKGPKVRLWVHTTLERREAVVSLSLVKNDFSMHRQAGSQGHTFSIVYGRNFGFSSVHHEFTHTSKVELLSKTNTTDCHHFFVKP